MLVVTGPTGNVGAELVRLLLAEGVAFRAAAHDPDGARREHGRPDLPVVRLDYDDRGTWPAVLDGVDTLFLLFPVPSPGAVRTRMLPFVDAAVAAGCRHIVYLSVFGGDSAKIIPHYPVERHIERSGVAYTILRCSFFMQNLCRRLSTHGVDIMDRDEVFVPAGRGRITFLDARDAALVALRAIRAPAEHHNTAYALTGPERLDFYEVAEVLSERFNRTVRYRRPSVPRFWWRLRRRGVTFDTIAFMTAVYTLTRLGRNEPVTGDLARLLDGSPRALPQFVTDYRPRFEQRAWT
ncbi:NmrA family NAD(P)-binding protein [Dactylosporangium siamense]|uniref:NmrA family transcriptional regulator n=1 Tax=Dactylosporangium siamense TaxID=685454 RepID=A0A919PD54_9ACTN|nr:NmrA family NAD(P)-binding protein [Dactylosporangium siamense]GIG42586.1 NmrA family transcriptional regulator [Dactylosporangium siamense]